MPYQFHCAIQSLVIASSRMGFTDNMIQDQLSDVMNHSLSGDNTSVLLNDGTMVQIKANKTWLGSVSGYSVNIKRSV